MEGNALGPESFPEPKNASPTGILVKYPGSPGKFREGMRLQKDSLRESQHDGLSGMEGIGDQ
jgi:hypothetical protein